MRIFWESTFHPWYMGKVILRLLSINEMLGFWSSFQTGQFPTTSLHTTSLKLSADSSVSSPSNPFGNRARPKSMSIFQAYPNCQVVQITPVDRMLAVCVDTHPLLVAHCRHFRLIIEQSDINIGQVKLRFVTDFFKFSQSVFIQDSGLVKATYNHSLNMLATLHSNWTMAVSRLDLDLDKRVCKHQVLTLTQVPFGLTLSEI